ncbi:MAG: D-2-hydroxyacid dehydrogenase [Chloroflexi bacterium]|nr:D-2-hydroxyacid dehydrogenase [Chloroflexota bacterium]
MPEDIPDPLVILVMMDEDVDLDAIRAVAPGQIEIHHEPPAAFEDEGGMFPPATGLKSFREPWSTKLSPGERDELLKRTHVLVNGLPYPLHLRDRMPNLLWAEFTFAGVSDYRLIDFWNTGVKITSGRGIVQALPIGEMVIAATLMFAKGLGTAQRQTEACAMDGSQFHNKLIAGKTMGVVGLGGIGSEVARLAKALGMRVVATRHSATKRQTNVDGIDTLYPSADLHAMLPECDFIAACMPLTPDTERVFDATAFAKMKDGAFFANIARGEVVDESALKDALRSGKLGGAYLDVYSEEGQRPPDPELMAFPNVVMTPHLSGNADVNFWPMAESFAANLRRFLNGEPLLNQVDFSRGY